jgi:hypothetical protein
MGQIINLSIDLSLVDKAKIKTVAKKDGSTGKYLNVTVFTKDEADQYGNTASICISQSKEEREAGAKTVYLGNGKIVGAKGAESKPTTNSTPSNDDDGLPF